MNDEELYPFAFAPVDVGCRNQILGAFHALSELTGNDPDFEELFVLPEGVGHYLEVKQSLKASACSSYKAFADKVFELLDAYFSHRQIVPKVFLTVYNPTESNVPGEDVDKLCRAVKEYYATRGLGSVFTAVLTSRYYKYKFVDFINIPKHLLTFSTRIRLLRHKKLRKKVLITTGTIHNFSMQKIKENYKELLKKMSGAKKSASLHEVVEKLTIFKNKPKKVVFCLGGRVESADILFDLAFAQKLYHSAEVLANKGYGVVFVNGPRTPNNVTDFLYEKSLKNKNILFQNSKKIAQTDEEREATHWRIYSGKHELVFKSLQKLGNIYPAVLGFKNTLVVHTMDSYSSCETASVGLPTAICAKGLYVDPNKRYDCYNLVKLLCPKYAIDFDEFMNLAVKFSVEPKDLSLAILSSSLRVFAETIVNRVNQNISQRGKINA